MDELFNVVQWFTNGHYEYVRRNVSAKEAFTAFKHYTTSVAVKLGMVESVRITDSGDLTAVEWIYGKGITFPTKEDIDKASESKP
jgi:hypothetical protein